MQRTPTIYWESIIDLSGQNLCLKYPEMIKELKSGELIPRKKHCGVATIVGFDMTYADRLLAWEYEDPFEKPHLVLTKTSDVLGHDYLGSSINSKQWANLKRLLESHKRFLDDYFHNKEKNKKKNPDNVSKESPLLGIHSGRVIEYNESQIKGLFTEYPLLLIGPAGCGKTTIQQKKAQDALMEKHDAPILWSTESIPLLDKQEKECKETFAYLDAGQDIFLEEKEKEWEEKFKQSPVYLAAPSEPLLMQEKNKWKTSIDYLNLKKIHFCTFEHLFAYFNQNKKKGDQAHFNTWFSNHIKTLKHVTEEKEKYDFLCNANLNEVYHALMVSVVYEKDDFMALGKKQCRFRLKKEKNWLWEVGRQYQADLGNDIYHPAFSRIKLPRFAVGLFDEIHNLTLMQVLLMIETCEGNVCLAMDHKQNLDGLRYAKRPHIINMVNQFFRKRNALKQAITPQEKKELKVIKLTSSERCPRQLEGTLNEILSITYTLGEGNPDPSYKTIECLGNENGGVYWLSTLEEKSCSEEEKKIVTLYQDILRNAADVVVITHEVYFEEARKLFGNKVWICTPEQAKGLEFDYVIVYRLFDSEDYEKSSIALAKNSNKNPSGNYPKEGLGNHNHERCMNESYVAFSRTKIKCIVIHLKAPHEVAKRLIAQCTKMESGKEATPVPVSTEKDWEEAIIKLLENGQRDLAFSRAKEKLGMDAAAFFELEKKYSPKPEPLPLVLPPALPSVKSCSPIPMPIQKFEEAIKKNDFETVKRLVENRLVNPRTKNNLAITLAKKTSNKEMVNYLQACKEIKETLTGEQVIAIAAKTGDIKAMEWLVNVYGADPSADKNNALGVAASSGQLAIVNFLLNCEKVNLDDKGEDALTRAIQNDRLNVVEALLAHKKVDPSAKNNLALDSAITKGHLAAVKLLLACDRIDPCASNHRAMQLAVNYRHLEIVKVLLSCGKGVNPNLNDDYPLRTAAGNGDLSMVAFLLSYPGVNACARNNEALYVSVRNGYLAVIECLLANSHINPNESMMDLASKNNHLPVVEFLSYWREMTQYAGFHFKHRKAIVALWKAINKNDLTGVEILTTSHMVNITNNAAIQLATKKGCEDCIGLYLKIGLSLKFKDHGDEQAMVKAAKTNDLETMNWLVHVYGADPGAQNNAAIKEACSKGHVGVVQFLLSCDKVDPGANHSEAVQLAAENGHLPVIALLSKSTKVDLSARSNRAMVLATENNHQHVVDFLRRQVDLKSMMSFFTAIRKNDFEGVKMLVENEMVNPHANDGAAMKIANKQGHQPIVNYLKSRPPFKDGTLTGEGALAQSARTGKLESVKWLIEVYGIDPSTAHNLPLRFAAAHGHANVVEFLLNDNRVDPSTNNNEAIHNAGRNQHLEVVKCLLAHPRVGKQQRTYLDQLGIFGTSLNGSTLVVGENKLFKI